MCPPPQNPSIIGALVAEMPPAVQASPRLPDLPRSASSSPAACPLDFAPPGPEFRAVPGCCLTVSLISHQDLFPRTWVFTEGQGVLDGRKGGAGVWRSSLTAVPYPLIRHWGRETIPALTVRCPGSGTRSGATGPSRRLRRGQESAGAQIRPRRRERGSRLPPGRVTTPQTPGSL